MLKTRKQKIFAALAILVVGIGIWLAFGQDPSPDPNADSGQPPIPVGAGRVTAHDVQRILVGIGTVQAYNTVTVHVRVDGELVNVAFHEGQDVKKGDLLAEIDPRPYQAALDNALAILAKDQATLANTRRDLGRYQALAPEGFASRQQLDTQAATVSSAVAAVQADQANIEHARIQLGYCLVRSPLDGRTGIRLVDQGNIVHATDTGGLVVITQLQPISAIFTLPQDRLPAVTAAERSGPATVVGYSRDDTTELGQGKLILVDNQIDPTTGTIRLKAEFANESHAFWPGQFINVRLVTGDIPNGLTVPSRAIQRGPNGSFVYVVKPDQTVEMRTVELGQEDRGETLVTKGVNDGDEIITDGQLRLQPGSKVQIIQSASAENDDPGGGRSQATATP